MVAISVEEAEEDVKLLVAEEEEQRRMLPKWLSMNLGNRKVKSHHLIPGVSLNQVEKLLSLIEASKSRGDKLSGQDEYLLDSEARYHMTGDFGKLNTVYPIFVGIPNGQNSVAHKWGRMVLNLKIIIYDVLYVHG